jgi:DNA end-binding protein Ku
MVKGYELKKGEYIAVEDEELKKLAPPTATTMDVLQFVAEDEVDPILFERSYYVAADEKVGKPYVLFLRALKETKRCAVAKLTMHGRENVVLIRASKDGLLLHTLFYADELNAANKPAIPSKTNPSDKELDLAKTLIGKFSAPFKLDQFHDAYRDNVAKLIEQKNKGEKITPIEQPKRAPVVDLMEALKRSLEQSGTRTRAAKDKPAKKRARKAA